MLAERELSNDLGWSWEEFGEPIPGSNGMLRANQEEVARLLLADEEQRAMQRKQAAKTRKRPNL